MSDLPEAEIIAIGLLAQWLEEKPKGETGMSWAFNNSQVETIPDGWYAAVRVELRKVGGEPEEVKYWRCTDCGNSHRVGEECPYVRKKVKPE